MSCWGGIFHSNAFFMSLAVRKSEQLNSSLSSYNWTKHIHQCCFFQVLLFWCTAGTRRVLQSCSDLLKNIGYSKESIGLEKVRLCRRALQGGDFPISSVKQFRAERLLRLFPHHIHFFFFIFYIAFWQRTQ